MPLPAGSGIAPARMLPWSAESISAGRDTVASRACRKATNSGWGGVSAELLVAGLLFGDADLDAQLPAPGLVVVAGEDTEDIGQGVQSLDGIVEHRRRTPGKVAARRAEVRHEQKVSHEDRVPDLVGGAGGGVSRCAVGANGQRTGLQHLPVALQHVH